MILSKTLTTKLARTHTKHKKMQRMYNAFIFSTCSLFRRHHEGITKPPPIFLTRMAKLLLAKATAAAAVVVVEVTASTIAAIWCGGRC